MPDTEKMEKYPHTMHRLTALGKYMENRPRKEPASPVHRGRIWLSDGKKMLHEGQQPYRLRDVKQFSKQQDDQNLPKGKEKQVSGLRQEFYVVKTAGFFQCIKKL